MPLVAFMNDYPTLGLCAPVPLGTAWVVSVEHFRKCVEDGSDPLEGMTHNGLTVAEWNEQREEKRRAREGV